MLTHTHTKATLLLFSLALILTLIFPACVKKSAYSWVVYDETVCSDNWNFEQNNERLKDNVIAYFKSKGVKIIEMEIFRDRDPEGCADCTCKTGRRYKCKVKNRDASEMKANGFYDN